MRLKRKAIGTVLTSFLIAFALFQNCSRSGAASSANVSSAVLAPNTTAAAGGGNGQGYDGMSAGLYVDLLASGTCADGSNIKSEIQVTNSSSVLLRAGCQTVPAANLNSSDLKTISSSYLVYEGSLFQMSETNSSLSLTLYLCVGSGNDPYAFALGMNGATAGMMGELTHLNSDSGPFAIQQTVASGFGFAGQDASGDQVSLMMSFSSQSNAGLSGTMNIVAAANSSFATFSGLAVTCYTP